MKVLEDSQKNLYVYIYTDDHEPAHVHVFLGRKSNYNEGEAKINIGNDEKPPSFVNVYNMNNKVATQALFLVAENQEILLKKWKEIHGGKIVEP